MMSAIWWIWRLRWVVLAVHASALIAGSWLRLQAVNTQLALSQMELAALRRANRENLAAIDDLGGERRLVERIMAERSAHARDQSDMQHRTIKKVIDHDFKKDCPLSPVVDDVLDGLSKPALDRDAG